MTLFGLMLRNLLFHWRGNLAVLLGVAVGTAVLTGALLVGDSLRGSLREQALGQLQGVDSALIAGRLMRQDLAREIQAEGKVAPALILQGSVQTVTRDDTQELPRRVGHVTVYGLDPIPVPAGLPRRSVIISRSIADELHVKVDDEIELSVPKASSVPREALLGRRDNESVVARITLTIAGVTPPSDRLSRFNLHPSPLAPNNLFINLADLQEALEQKGKINALLVAGGSTSALQEELTKRLKLEDWGLVLSTPQSRTDDLFHTLDPQNIGVLRQGHYQGQIPGVVVRGADANKDKILTREELITFYRAHHPIWSVESGQMLLEPAAVRAVEQAAREKHWPMAPTLVYLANSIAANGEQIPYSVVAALDPALLPPLGPFLPEGVKELRDDEIILAGWKDSPLSVKPGDEVTLTYYAPEGGDQLPQNSATFKFVGFVPLDGVAADPDLAPRFPGITDQLSIEKWNPPFRIERKLVKPRDELFWREYRTTPKAYVTLKHGQDLWGSRFGQLTSIRIDPRRDGQGSPANDAEDVEKFKELIRSKLNPEAGGFVFDPVRERALEASAGGTDFGMLFLSFSFFLIVSALLLVGLLFRLNLDRRASEIGLLLATGYRLVMLRWLLLSEGAVVAVFGGVLGSVLAVLYSHLLLTLLRTLWPGGLGESFLRLHVTVTSLAIGFGAAVVMSLLTIFRATRSLRRVPLPTLLAGVAIVETNVAKPEEKLRWSLRIAMICALLALALLPLAPLVRDNELRAFTFFSSGALLLTAALAAAWSWLRGSRQGHVQGRGIGALATLGVRNAARNPSRSLLTAGLLASAAFLLVAVESFRPSAGDNYLDKSAGSGGFALIADSDVPVYQDLNSEKGKEELASILELRLHNKKAAEEQVAKLDGSHIESFRVHAGDDASCLNLYQPRKPRLLGVPPSLVECGGFRWSGTLAESPAEMANPWRLLDRTFPDGAIPVIGEAKPVTWMLKSGLGKDITTLNAHGDTVKLRVVGLLSDSVFQSGLLLSDANFLKLFPGAEGYNFFLIKTPTGRDEEVKTVLESALGERGFEVTTSAHRLEAYLAVENTYLSTFQALGGMGLFLGTLGLAVVLLRSVWERRGELALLRALGYRHSALGWLLFSENSFLLVLGLGIGALTALLAVVPHLMGGEGSVPWLRLLGMLAAVLLTGLVTAEVTLRLSLRAPLIPALRRE
jgi:ABC-type antimicrobial peptide transport system permease subunit